MLFTYIYILVHVCGVDCTDFLCSQKFKKLGDAHLLLKILMFALVSHVLLVIHMKSSTLQVGPFST